MAFWRVETQRAEAKSAGVGLGDEDGEGRGPKAPCRGRRAVGRRRRLAVFPAVVSLFPAALVGAGEMSELAEEGDGEGERERVGSETCAGIGALMATCVTFRLAHRRA